MESSNKILNLITNIKSETAQIRQLASEQVDTDFFKHWAEDDSSMEKRTVSLRRIYGNAADIDLHCEAIKANVNLGNTAKEVKAGESEEEEEKPF